MARRRTSTRRRTGRVRRKKLGLLDHLGLAACAAGVVYLILTNLGAPNGPAAVAGLIAFGFALGAVVRLPRWRSPIVWRRRR